MAGSYRHCVDNQTGKLLVNEQLQGMLECCSGDVYEAVEQMYGMIWWLAAQLQSVYTSPSAEFVEAARQEWKLGLVISPGTDGQLAEED